MSANVKSEPERYVLDSFALLAHLEGEPGGSPVKVILERADRRQAEVYLSVINYGEVVSITERERELTATQEVIAVVDHLPITIVDADRKLTFDAVHLRARFSISYADTVALALAEDRQAILVTGDPQFRKVEQLVTIEWLP